MDFVAGGEQIGAAAAVGAAEIIARVRHISVDKKGTGGGRPWRWAVVGPCLILIKHYRQKKLPHLRFSITNKKNQKSMPLAHIVLYYPIVTRKKNMVTYIFTKKALNRFDRFQNCLEMGLFTLPLEHV